MAAYPHARCVLARREASCTCVVLVVFMNMYVPVTLIQSGVDTTPLPLYGHHFWYYKQFLVRRSVHWLEIFDH